MKKNIFDSYDDWLDSNGSCSPLHAINDIRFNYIKTQCDVKNKKILDLGCGGGLLSLKLSKHGAYVIGLDKSKNLIDIANINVLTTKINRIKYINLDFLEFKSNLKFDVILCMEMIEHLNNINDFFIFLNNVASSNTLIFISSLDKCFISYFNIIFFGEYILKKLKKNTHDYFKFLTMKNMINLFDKNKFNIIDVFYMNYNFFFNFASFSYNITHNYILKIKKC